MQFNTFTRREYRVKIHVKNFRKNSCRNRIQKLRIRKQLKTTVVSDPYTSPKKIIPDPQY